MRRTILPMIGAGLALAGLLLLGCGSTPPAKSPTGTEGESADKAPVAPETAAPEVPGDAADEAPKPADEEPAADEEKDEAEPEADEDME